MRRVLLTAFVAVALAAAASDARAGGPILFFRSGSAGPHVSLRAAIERQIASNLAALAHVRRRRGLLDARLQRLQTELLHSTDPFNQEDAIGQVQSSIASTQARIDVLRSVIHRLRAALQPVELPAAPTRSSPSGIGWDAVAIAEHYLGVRYQWGGSNPQSGFDCSGFAKYVYARLGLTLPHYAASQFAMTPHIDPNTLQAGDLVFFEPHADGPGHVGIYVGEGQLVEAPHTGDVVKLAPVADLSAALGLVGATRPARLLR